MSFLIRSSAFARNEPIPTRFTGDGDDVSPPLYWTGVPRGTKQLALVVDDPDAPTTEPWVHWVIYNIPAGATSLPESVAKAETSSAPGRALQGKNSWNKIGYGGPAPPTGHGLHHYHFKLYALDAALGLPGGLDKKGLLAAMQGHVIKQAELIGTYQR